MFTTPCEDGANQQVYAKETNYIHQGRVESFDNEIDNFTPTQLVLYAQVGGFRSQDL
jgi:hypothetical protein